jgi:hypothetical protein
MPNTWDSSPSTTSCHCRISTVTSRTIGSFASPGVRTASTDDAVRRPLAASRARHRERTLLSCGRGLMWRSTATDQPARARGAARRAAQHLVRLAAEDSDEPRLGRTDAGSRYTIGVRVAIGSLCRISPTDRLVSSRSGVDSADRLSELGIGDGGPRGAEGRRCPGRSGWRRRCNPGRRCWRWRLRRGRPATRRRSAS